MDKKQKQKKTKRILLFALILLTFLGSMYYMYFGLPGSLESHMNGNWTCIWPENGDAPTVKANSLHFYLNGRRGFYKAEKLGEGQWAITLQTKGAEYLDWTLTLQGDIAVLTAVKDGEPLAVYVHDNTVLPDGFTALSPVE